MANVIQDPKLNSFVQSQIDNDFGLTVEQIARQCGSYGRFSAWLNGDVNRITDLLNVVKQTGVSPAFFAAYEVTEGYNSSWGWLNHTSVDGNPTQDAISVSQWIVSQSNDMSGSPAWIDYANYNDFVPASVKEAGNNDFKNLPQGSIGRVVIAGTAAATWEVYYPQGLLAEYNGVQDYGKPLTNMVAMIEQWGGNVGEGGMGGSKPAFPTTNGLPITSKYGWRTHPISGEQDFHGAIDIGGGPTNHPIYATQTGSVLETGFNDSMGYYIRIEHTGDNYYSQYIHLAEQASVSNGDTVSKGQQIGIMGTTGSSTGIHLDFAIAIHSNGWFTEEGTIDPEKYLEMTFGDNGGGGSNGVVLKDIINLLLADALNGWKY